VPIFRQRGRYFGSAKGKDEERLCQTPGSHSGAETPTAELSVIHPALHGGIQSHAPAL